jgi:hypothetical protein
MCFAAISDYRFEWRGSFDGHVWVERGGKIVDPWFPKYERVASYQNTTKERVYLPAPPKTQIVWLDLLKRFATKNQTIGYGYCPNNAQLEIAARGGRMVFGSMGFLREDGSVWWEYGCPELKKPEDFDPRTLLFEEDDVLRVLGRGVEQMQITARQERC